MSSKTSFQGIYLIQNTNTGESYVGSAKNIQKRLSSHIIDLTSGIHMNPLLQESWVKYGPTVFIFRILEIVDSSEELLNKEILWILELDAVENGFNVKSNQFKYRKHIKVKPETHFKLDELDLGSMNKALANLLKYYKKFHGNNS